eukprot:CAMPEP_0194270872 /NCGR_PEP_ID=MMETSP0169-20130528/4780_1 /TAXON_ID=218684 /ORGANISM="Corethron pennatum, Strain L29A3" /LENGTH=184 /DNA_ID=CAMNT_0039013069 /DNA_START=511 /DNA_END=1062 /DNA_ORIENTATION=-
MMHREAIGYKPPLDQIQTLQQKRDNRSLEESKQVFNEGGQQIAKLDAEKVAEKIKRRRMKAARVKVERNKVENMQTQSIKTTKECRDEEHQMAEHLKVERIEAKRSEADFFETERLKAQRLEATQLELNLPENGWITVKQPEVERLKLKKFKNNEIKMDRLKEIHAEKEKGLEDSRIEAGQLEA